MFGFVRASTVGLVIILIVAISVGVIFAIDPSLDVKIALFFRTEPARGYVVAMAPVIEVLRDVNRAYFVCFILIAILSLVVRFVWPFVPALFPSKAALLIIGVTFLGPILVTEGVLKPLWSRPRPLHIVELGGVQQFAPWWQTNGPCRKNCSFVSSEVVTAFSMIAVALVVPLSWQPLCIGAALMFGLAMAAVRLTADGHFFTDVVFGAVLACLTVWFVHGLLFRWSRTAISSARIDAAIGKFAQSLRKPRASRRGAG